MPLKRPVTLAQARRWPAAAKRRESFCARMGGMRRVLTGEEAARDPDSPINRALAAWDCDKPEGLKREHVSKGIRPMKITSSNVGSEARNPARKNPASVMVHGYAVIWNDAKSGEWQTVALTLKKPDAVEIAQLLADKHKERYAVQPRFIHEKDLEVY
jgi:hypothetical protein